MRRNLVVVLTAATLLIPAVAAHADERRWLEVPLPSLWPEFQISELAGAGPNEAWIAGYEGKNCVSWSVPGWGNPSVCSMNAIVRKWNGAAWENKNPPGLWNLQVEDLEASSRTNVWLTGQNLQGQYLARWDGTRWTQITAPPGCFYPRNLHPVGSDELWASFSGSAWGDSCVARWKAGTWQVHPFTARTIDFVGSPAPGEVHISTNTVEGLNTRATLRFTGSGWEPAPTPASHPALSLAGGGALYYRVWNRQDTLKVTTEGTETIPAAPDGASPFLLDDLGRLWASNASPTLYRYDAPAWVPVPTSAPFTSSVTSLPESNGVLWTLSTTGSPPVHHTHTNG